MVVVYGGSELLLVSVCDVGFVVIDVLLVLCVVFKVKEEVLVFEVVVEVVFVVEVKFVVVEFVVMLLVNSIVVVMVIDKFLCLGQCIYVRGGDLVVLVMVSVGVEVIVDGNIYIYVLFCGCVLVGV